MSKAVAATIPIGPVQAYWNNVRLGSPKSVAAIRHNKETVQAGLPDSGVNVISHKVKETVEIDITIADFKIEQMRYVYDAAVEFAATPIISTIAYDASTATVIRFKETHELSGTANITLGGAGYLTGTIMVFKSDWSNTPDGYTKGTDYTSDSAAGTVARITGGDITDGDAVHIEYNHTSTVAMIGAGGEMADFEAQLRLVMETDSGKHIQIYAHRAKKIGASDNAFSMADEYGGIAMTFHILADMTKLPSKQLIEVSVEA